MFSYSYTIGTDFTSLIGTEVDLYALQNIIYVSLSTVQYLTRLVNEITIYFSGDELTIIQQNILTDIINAYVYVDTKETIVSNSSITTFSNKLLNTDTNFFVDDNDVSKKIGFDTSGSDTGRILTLLATTTTTDKTIIFPDVNDTLVTLNATQILTEKTITNGIFDGTGSNISSLTTAYFNPSTTEFSGSNDYFFTYLNTPTTTGNTTGTASTFYIAGAPSNANLSYSLNVASGNSLYNGNITLSNGNTLNIGTSGINSTLNIFGTSNNLGSTNFTGKGNTTASSANIYSNPALTTITGSSDYYFNYFDSPTTLSTDFSGTASTIFIAGAPTSTTGGTGFALNIADGVSKFSGTNASTSSNTGIILSSGGIGISNTTDAINSTNGGTFTTAGGLSIAKQAFIGTNLTLSGESSVLSLSGESSILTLTNASSSTTSNTGALRVNGGAYFGAPSILNGLTVNGPIFYGVQDPITTNTVVNYSSNQGSSLLIPLNPNSPITITLPAITKNPSVEFYFIHISDSAISTITVADISSETFDDGSTSIILSKKYDRIKLKSFYNANNPIIKVWLIE